MAQLSANVGYVTDYVFRGIYQEESSAFAGLDYESDNGFYVGTWGADVGGGLETDVYFGYSGGEDFTYTIGYTGYFYTDDWDDTYTEINLGIGYGIFSLDHAIGEWDGFGTPSDYTFTSITIAPEGGYYFKFGSFGDEADGDYFELGYGFDFMGLDLSLALINSDELQVFQGESSDVVADTQLVFGISKGISIGE
jgi:uncharacterized protein (TIGR02001 family)